MQTSEVNRKIKWHTKGEIDSFDALYENYAGLVRSVLYRLCAPEDLNDLVQETFLKIWKGLPGFAGKSSLKSWVYRVAYNVAVDRLRKNKNKELLLKENQEVPSEQNLPETLRTQELVQKGLRTLSEDHRTVLVLNALEGLTIEEIAAIIEVPEGTVKSRLHHARENIKKYLQSQGVYQ